MRTPVTRISTSSTSPRRYHRVPGSRFLVEIEPNTYEEIETVRIPREETVGLHSHHMTIMLDGLKQALAVNDRVSVTLHFNQGATWTISVPIRNKKPVHGKDPYH